MPAAVLDSYLKARDRVREKKQAEDHAHDMELLEQRLRMELADQTANVRRHILETVLTTACPCCGAAFLDFEGCMALKCSRAGCGCGFCAICLENCGSNAHPHVLACQFNTSRDYFASKASFQEMQKAWRTARVKEVSSFHTYLQV